MSNPADDILGSFGLPTSTEPGYTKGPRYISPANASRYDWYDLDRGGRSRRRRAHRARRSRKAMKAGKRSRRAARRASRR